ncbi:hypothetical protein HG530_003986 [Fusarium avenaceum]|nr:hypothetical protein HG530_003986 [Fusarium avenaceum]
MDATPSPRAYPFADASHMRDRPVGDNIHEGSEKEPTRTEDKIGTSSNSNIGLSATENPHGFVDSYQAGGTRRVNGHGRTVPVEKVRQAVGHDAPRRSCSRIHGKGIDILLHHGRPVIAHHTDVDGSLGALEVFHWQASGAERVIDRLHQQSLLRVYTLSLFGRDVKEGSVEFGRVILQQNVPWLLEELPELRGGVAATWKAARTADDGNRLTRF